jgi:hypothetical protein
VRIRGRVIKNFNTGKAIKKYFHWQMVFMILMTCLLGRMIYQNDRMGYTLNDIQSLLLGSDTFVTRAQQRGVANKLERNTVQVVRESNGEVERSMNEMNAGETRYVGGYKIRKVRNGAAVPTDSGRVKFFD